VSDRPGENTERATNAVLLRARLFGVAPALLIGLVIVALAGPVAGVLAFVVLTVLWIGFVEVRRRTALDRALTSLGPTDPLAEGAGSLGASRWANIVDGVAVSTGVESPELRHVPLETLNAAVLAQDGRTVLVATAGLMSHLSQIELEAVAANLLGRVRDGSAQFTTIAVGLPGPSVAGSSPFARWLVDGLGEQRAVRSDLEAARLTRYPPGVVRALRVVGERGSLISGAAPASAAFWLAPAVDPADVPEAVAATVMQSIELRTAVLEEL